MIDEEDARGITTLHGLAEATQRATDSWRGQRNDLIIQLRDAGHSTREIADATGLTTATIRSVYWKATQ